MVISVIFCTFKTTTMLLTGKTRPESRLRRQCPGWPSGTTQNFISSKEIKALRDKRLPYHVVISYRETVLPLLPLQGKHIRAFSKNWDTNSQKCFWMQKSYPHNPHNRLSLSTVPLHGLDFFFFFQHPYKGPTTATNGSMIGHLRPHSTSEKVGQEVGSYHWR